MRSAIGDSPPPNDGDQDLILAQNTSGSQMWGWENPYPDFSKPWKRYLITNTGGRKRHDQTIGDYDGDGRLDIPMKPNPHDAPRVDVLLNRH